MSSHVPGSDTNNSESANGNPSSWFLGAHGFETASSSFDPNDPFCPLPVTRDSSGSSTGNSLQGRIPNEKFLTDEVSKDGEGDRKLESTLGRNSRSNSSEDASASRNKKKHGPGKRPLDAYSLFFRNERARMISSLKKPDDHEDAATGKRMRSKNYMNPEEMERQIQRKWNQFPPSEISYYVQLAESESEKYRDKLRESGSEDESSDKQLLTDSRDPGEAGAPLGHTFDAHNLQAYPLPPDQGIANPTAVSTQGNAGSSPPDDVHFQPPMYPHYGQPSPYVQIPQPQWLRHEASERIEFPPSQSVTMNDPNGVTRRYKLMYAAVPMPYETASNYIMSLYAATRDVMQGSENNVTSFYPRNAANGDNFHGDGPSQNM